MTPRATDLKSRRSTGSTPKDEREAPKPSQIHAQRRRLLVVVLAMVPMILGVRVLDLQGRQSDVMQARGEARYARVVPVPAHRGQITDRHGVPLALSTPMPSIWMDPRRLPMDDERVARLAECLDTPVARIRAKARQQSDRAFVYLKRRVRPELAETILALDLPGIHTQREYRRFYPSGEAIGPVVGVTNIDDVGQEGLELAFEQHLRGEPGTRRILRDRRGRVIDDSTVIEPPSPGRDLRLGLDRRIQYLAFRSLKKAVDQHDAKGGSVVAMDARSGEILAMTNWPTFNPNDRSTYGGPGYRNRAVTDVFEPGSTIKPFTILAALESGRFHPDTPIATSPGTWRVAGHRIQDVHDYGQLDVAGVIRKSSNVGVTKIAMQLEPDALWSIYHRAGIGQTTLTGFPGEASGVLRAPERWRRLEQATMAFGYGMSTTGLQLAHAYSVFATRGIARAPTFLTREQRPEGRRAFNADNVRHVNRMLESVVGPEGTGDAAQIPGYRVAGKTGTVHKVGASGYERGRYLALFAGFAPVSQPRLVVVVAIHEPSREQYYGGQVAAPVFQKVMRGALRFLAVPPDASGERKEEFIAARPTTEGPSDG